MPTGASPAAYAGFFSKLRSQLDSAAIIENAEAEGMLVDERQQFLGKPLAVVAPKSVDQVARLVRLCHEHRIPVVPQGGNTGYCGGATPDESGNQVLLSLQNLNKVREIDVAGQSLTVEAGVILVDVQAAAAAQNLLFPLSMGSEGSCQIGGNLSTNAGGLAVLRYGTARDLVLGLEVVTPQGEVLSELKTLRKDTTGYDLKQLYIGAEGTLGVITAASLKLFPAPSTRFVCWLAVPNISQLPNLLRKLQAQLGDAVTSFEYISRRSLEFVLENIETTKNPLDGRYAHTALVEISGFEAQANFAEKCIDALAVAQKDGLIEDAALSHSEAQAIAIWRLRESIPRAEKLLGGSLKHDVSVPVSRISEMITEASQAVLSIESQARLSVYGHVGDGNVHFNLLPPKGVSLARFKADKGEQISRAVHHVADSLKGSFSAEHGVGQLKTAELALYSSDLRLRLMRDVKEALDPHGLMNPGKVIELMV